MTDKERQAAGERLIREYTLHLDFIRTSTVLLGLLPVLYGILTWVFGDALWATSPVYRTALTVPLAPQSWGTVFIALGVLTVWFSGHRNHRGSAVVTALTALVLASFMVSFLIEGLRSQTIGVMPPAVVYGIFSVLFLSRSRLSWELRK